MRRTTIALALALGTAACASAPPAKPVGPTFEQKVAAILRLEDHRVLRDPVPPGPPAPVRGKRAASLVTPPPQPDLIGLLSDSEARVRRRAALAVGRVGLGDGVQPLLAMFADADAEVRQMAAFALGLIGDKRARDPLVAALRDQSPLMQASAAEALGLLGDSAAADPIARAVAQVVQSGALAQAPGDDADVRRDTPAAVFRLGVCALARLKAYEPLAAAVLDQAGQPRVRWWPVAYALAQLEDRRAMSALVALAKDANPYTRAFAVKGLGALKDRAAVPVLLPLLTSGDRSVLIETIRALGRVGDPATAAPLLKVVRDVKTAPPVRLEAVAALGGIRATAIQAAPDVIDALLDMLSEASPAIRAAALQSAAAIDSDGFVTVLSGLDPDPDWRVRAALASVLGTLAIDVTLPRLNAMLADSDQRVIPAVLASLVKLHAPGTETVLLDRLKADDPIVRAAAANGVGDLRPAGGAPALEAAYQRGQRDTTYVARAAALAALSKYGTAAATPVLRTALADKDWAVRVRAAALLRQLDPSADVDTEIRPAPSAFSPDVYSAPRVVNPPVSTQIYLDTDRGTIQVELAVLDAPLTAQSFVTLAQKGFFDGLGIHRVVPGFVMQDGDPRGDGEGGPGYTIRDELNESPYLRGVVGMALDWPDSGGSRFFITHSPQPQLDAKHTVFGRVVAGMEVVDAVEQGDVIRRVRVWDGVAPGAKN